MKTYPEKIPTAGLGEGGKLFDYQVNGFAGVDFQSPELTLEAMRHAVERPRRHRMAKILLTLVTDSVESLCRKLERMEALRRSDPVIAKVICGYHLEGPWISREAGYHGAHPRELVCEKARVEDFKKLQEAAGGNIRLVTLAPEVRGAVSVIEVAVKAGVRVGLGHTNAPETAIDEAIRAGATLAIHVGNAVPSLLHRHDNVIQRLLARDELFAGLIPDGIHLPPFVLKNFYRSKPEGKVFFTTDCMAAAGAPPGRYRLAGLDLEVGGDGVVHLPGDERFAGSSLTLDRGVVNLTRWLGLSLDEAVRLCSTPVADHFGISLQDL